MTTRTLIALASSAILAACAAGSDKTSSGVSIHASFSMAPASLAVVTIDAQPAGVTAELAYDAASGEYAGVMSLPAGPQFLAAQAWTDEDQDGVLELFATGSAVAVIAEDQVAGVVIRLVSVAPPPPVPDHAPLITSLEIGNVNPLAGESVAVSVVAVDVDNDPMTYFWMVDCNAGRVTIQDPTASATTFSVDAPATCRVSVGVSANGKVNWANLSFQVGGPGQADVSVTFVAPPMITQVVVSDAVSGFSCAVDRHGAEASCPGPLGLGALVDVFVTVDADSIDAPTSLWTCGGVVTLVSAGAGTAHYTWEAPLVSGVCLLTPRVVRDGIADVLPVALLLQ